MPIVLPLVAGQQTVPGAPSLTSVTAADSGATATWTAPASDGGSAITGYTVTVRVAATGATALVRAVAGTVLSATLAPLVNDVGYLVSVVAINGSGSSLPSSVVTATPTSTGGTVDPGSDPGGSPTPIGQPSWRAFPVERAFTPVNWLLTQDQATA